MITASKTNITVKTELNEPVEKVWSFWNEPKHIVNWAFASDDWYVPAAENNLMPGGTFQIRMEARDGSDGFDFSGEYDSVVLLKQIKYTLSDGRNVRISFETEDNKTLITMVVETETHNPVDFQQQGWQSILNNFRKYVERSARFVRLHFEILIDAGTEKVYTLMIDENHYREWTSEFNPTSRFKGSWKKGSKILFIGDAPDGSQGGMVGMIRENIPSRFISIEHIGIVENGTEILKGPAVDGWAGARENYTFAGKNEKTLLLIDTDCIEQYRQDFLNMWPKALQKLKSICESAQSS